MHINTSGTLKIMAGVALIVSPVAAYQGVGMMYTGIPAAVGLGGFAVLMAGIAFIISLLGLMYL